jgi:hypothetical protein
VDGQTVEDAQQDAAPLIAALRHALLTGCLALHQMGIIRMLTLN